MLSTLAIAFFYLEQSSRQANHKLNLLMRSESGSSFTSRVKIKNLTDKRKMLVSALNVEGINNQAVLKAIRKIPRHEFVDKELEEYAYDNRPLPIKHDQTISQPYIVAYMVQAANLNSNSRVLEIGTGSGYMTAILAEICREVFTIEIREELARDATSLLKTFGYKNISFKIGDGNEGWPEAAPFDAIIASATAKKIPPALIQQLTIGGTMIIPLLKATGEQVLTQIIKVSHDNYNSIDLLDVRFVPMVKKG